METLSVVIVTRNEEARLRACLESVAWADQIIVVDSLSEDGTVAVAAEFTPDVHRRPWPGYASQKNFGIDQATGDWILILDADERVSAELRGEIQGLLAGGAEHPVYRVPFKNHLAGRWLAHGGLYPDYHPRLFRRGAARYGEREIHETLQYAGGSKPSRGRLRGAILHLTYADLANYLEKVNRYTSLEADALAAEGHRVRWWHLLKPIPRFFKLYVRKKGFLDGVPGLASAVLLAVYPLLVQAKVLERQHQAKSPGSGAKL
jgi:glycosyltransferase involved in cell wall biosynthesis